VSNSKIEYDDELEAVNIQEIIAASFVPMYGHKYVDS